MSGGGAESPVRYPGEDEAYRAARNELLAAEVDLRRRIEEVAKLRRTLPPGGRIPEDYEFAQADGATDGDGSEPTVPLSDLFDEGKDTLFVYGLMFHPEADQACPMCTSLLDGLNGQARYIEQRINLAVVAKAHTTKLWKWADGRGWRNLRLLSSRGTSFNRDYHGEDADGNQLPFFQVFRRTPEGIRHWYGSELSFAPTEEGMDPRHADPFWPLWGVLDLTPEGRGKWYPERVPPGGPRRSKTA